MSFPHMVAGERSATKKPETKSHGFFISIFLHLALLLSAVIFGAQSTSNEDYSMQSSISVMQARLVFTPSQLPVIEDEGTGEAEKQSERLPNKSNESKKKSVKENVSRASDRFDDALALAEMAVSKTNSVELQRTALESTPIKPDVIKPFSEKKIRPPPVETPIEKPLDVDVPPMREKTVKRDDVIAIDPLLAYQQKIGLTLQRNLRLSEYEKIGRCVLKMELSRDGMVLNTAYVSGSKNLCGEAERAAIRVGRMPMPADDALYAELTKLYVTVTGTGF
jgi:colicin import membrane protein